MTPTDAPDRALSRAITGAFFSGTLDLSARPNAPTPGWDAMPECVAVKRLRADGAADVDVRVFLTLIAALDRARDADRLWAAGTRTWSTTPWVFRPAEVVQRPHLDLLDALRRHGVSQRHTVDASAWRTIAEALTRPDLAGVVHRAVLEGVGAVQELREGLAARTPGGTALFPMLQGPKVALMWMRLLAAPGGAQISGLETLEVAVDVQVRRVGEHLGLTATAGQPVEVVRRVIQDAWQAQVSRHGAAGPVPIGGTAAALDPALWFFGKWGCAYCEKRGRRVPVHAVCAGCQFTDTTATAPGT
jgi:hypothetical protein